MYSAFYKELKPKKAPKKQTIQFKLPLPIHHGEFLLKTQKDFELPPSILEEHERGDIKPSFIQVRENLFTGPKRRFPRQEAATCQCERPPKGQLGCGDDCLNRMLFYECDTMACACGDQCSNRRFQKKAYIEELETFQTAHRGWGLRTLVNIKRGELITEYCGEVISTDMCNQRMQTIYKNKKNFYFLEYAHGQVIDAGMKGSVARFINHSCDPNCHIEKWAFKHQLFVGVFASRDITAGEELFYDYNFATFGEGQDQACYCGSQKCRGTIGKKPPQKQG
ncbi:hypothetical protein BX666DRAFT_1955066 [Dichotomocladium elegans]|nr:hypothetical protein BX666DRAFT_1955066 [Dichotomocladium elegans]